jgi:hypothetical protein
MAMAFTSLGLAGLLLANLATTGFLGGAAPAAGPAGQERLSAGGAAASSAPAAPAAGLPQPSGDLVFGTVDQASPGSGITGTKAGDTFSAPPAAISGGTGHGNAEQPSGARDSALVQAPINPFMLASIALLGIGLALFALRFVARRVR